MADPMPSPNPMVKPTLVATALQLVMVVAGHYSPQVAALFAPMGTTISGIGGLLYSLWNRQATVPNALTGGVVAGGGSALLGILVSYFLGDVPTSTLYIGTGASAVAGAVGGVIGRLVKARSAT